MGLRNRVRVAVLSTLVLVGGVAPAHAAAGDISTFAGGAFGDGGAATAAPIPLPTGVAAAPDGSVYIADAESSVVRKVSPSGVITTVAGRPGFGGYSGDGGPATSALLSDPRGLAVGPDGSLYIADSWTHTVRRVSPAGIITTVAGVGVSGFSGDGGPAILARLNGPFGVSLGIDGSLYIADSNNHRIRKVVAPLGIVVTVAGNGTAGFAGDGGPAVLARLNFPLGVEVAGADALYIADSSNHRIRKVFADLVISTVAGTGIAGFAGDGGPAVAARLDRPAGITLDRGGSLHWTEWGNARVRRMSPSGVVETVAGNGTTGFAGDGGPATSASLSRPFGLAISAGTLYIADTLNRRVRAVSPSGVIGTAAGNGEASFAGDGGRAASATLSSPQGVAVDGTGAVFIADTSNNRIRRVSPSGIITTVAGDGNGDFTGDGGPAASARLHSPAGMAFDAAGSLYFADLQNNRVRKIAPSGTITTVAGDGTPGFSGDGGPATAAWLDNPRGVAIDSAGTLYIADWGNHRIRRVLADGTITTVAGSASSGFFGDGGAATAARLYYPEAVAVDATGQLIIADTGNYRVRIVSPSGTITTIAGDGTAPFKGDGGPATSASVYPHAVVVDDGVLFIGDGARVRKVTSAGIITSVAGVGFTAEASGDGGPATAAGLGSAMALAFDTPGSLYVADKNHNRVRRVEGPI